MYNIKKFINHINKKNTKRIRYNEIKICVFPHTYIIGNTIDIYYKKQYLYNIHNKEVTQFKSKKYYVYCGNTITINNVAVNTFMTMEINNTHVNIDKWDYGEHINRTTWII